MRIALIVLAGGLGLVFGWGVFALGALNLDNLPVTGEDAIAGASFCAMLAAVTAAVAFETE